MMCDATSGTTGAASTVWQQELKDGGAFYIQQAHDNVVMAQRLIARFGSLELNPGTTLGADEEATTDVIDAYYTTGSTDISTCATACGSSAKQRDIRCSSVAAKDVRSAMCSDIIDLDESSKNDLLFRPRDSSMDPQAQLTAFATAALDSRLSELQGVVPLVVVPMVRVV
eukprot:Lankesteria_metandrocarpae@DN3953_c0_g1_i2.p2